MALGNGEARPEEELRDLGNEPLGILPVVPEHMLRDGWVADHHKVPGPSGEPVDGPTLVHPLEKRQEKGATEEVGDVIELRAGDRYPGVVTAAQGHGACKGGQPIRANP